MVKTSLSFNDEQQVGDRVPSDIHHHSSDPRIGGSSFLHSCLLQQCGEIWDGKSPGSRLGMPPGSRAAELWYEVHTNGAI